MAIRRVAIYTRVSTDKRLKAEARGEDKGQDPKMQLRLLQEYAEARGWEVVYIGMDYISGRGKLRPDYEEVLKLARRRSVDAVLVYALDRWGRSPEETITTMAELVALGVGFYSHTEAMDLTTPMGRAMAGILSIISGLFLDVTKRRIKDGLENARAKGKRLGRPPLAQSKVKEILGMLSDGTSWTRIIDTAKVSRWSVAKIAALLKEETANLTPEERRARAVEHLRGIMSRWYAERGEVAPGVEVEG